MDSLIVCRCEGVTLGEIRECIETDSPDSHSHLRTLTRAGMGVCQGRVCSPVVAKLMASKYGRPLEAFPPFPAARPARVVPLIAFDSPESDVRDAATVDG